MQVKMLENEYWWGGCICDAENMPYDSNTVYSIDLLREKRTQTSPLFVSSKGRYLWCEDPYRISFDHGVITTEACDLHSCRVHRTPSPEARPVILGESEDKTLRGAYLAAMQQYFPFEENIHTPREYYEHPQFNTWMELVKNQNEKDVLQYAQELLDHGYKPGILTIDGSWQKAQGVWEFNPDRFTDPKGMFRKLHEMGFTVMIWASPFRCAEDGEFYNLYVSRPRGEDGELPATERNYDHLVRVDDGEVSIFKWWSGFSAHFNFNLPGDVEYLDKKLQYLLDCGADGFKFDGGTYRPDGFLNGETLYGPWNFADLNIAWIDFGSRYKFHEYKDTWKAGGKKVMQRLFDKRHSWDKNGLNTLIPHGCFSGLIGCPFICPDMVGGGEWTTFLYGDYDEELFIRMAQCSALFPMMQYSSLPWRHMSQKVTDICLEMAQLHEKMYPEIEKVLSETEKTGEPMIRSMEYQYPGHGYEKINDQFMLGDSILVAPVIVKGQRVKSVAFPEGIWKDEEGNCYTGGTRIDVDAPLEKLPWFRKVSE